jgi:S1-C subfamily serine protease
MIRKLLALCVVWCASVAFAWGQADSPSRNNNVILSAFRDVVAPVRESTARILCDGKSTALGLVVGADGWIITKYHDLTGDITCKVNGLEYPAKLVGCHEAHDLALLKVDAKNLTQVLLCDSGDLKAGRWLASVGLGEDPICVGVVSVPTRQTGAKPAGKASLNRVPGTLGVFLEPTDNGLKIAKVNPNSAASKAGLKDGDVILSLNGRTYTDVDEFRQNLMQHKPGDDVALTYRRGEENKEVTAKLTPPQGGSFGSGRAEFQNKMGNELSSRRVGYTTILQHDGVVRPQDCGGAIVDLRGRVVGINISRAGRVETWAIPAEVVRSLLPDLKNGRLIESKEQMPKAK